MDNCTEQSTVYLKLQYSGFEYQHCIKPMDRPFNANKPNFCSRSIYVVTHCASLYYVLIIKKTKQKILINRCQMNAQQNPAPLVVRRSVR